MVLKFLLLPLGTYVICASNSSNGPLNRQCPSDAHGDAESLASGPSMFQASNPARRSVDSSPSHSATNHSQMSRNSSKKSSNSVNCKIDGEH